VFPYSRRPGTEAAAFTDAPAKDESRRRAAILKAFGAAKRTAFAARHAGRVMDVLVETTRDEATGLLKGFTDNYIPVLFEGGEELKGRLARAVLDGAGRGRLADAP
ncbi:MAG: tRNA (N(6)-L-threonylcarbamoyladenosine(37)-C(2))-methylthiotransferase MtaB, partial [Nitrospinae bacterium]|nr:tRNA (N(6)-L-threonylcarbamoyladenosine(37)-C(2))-methylthiotransferase MtaB [Nitrospinota bacterium]